MPPLNSHKPLCKLGHERKNLTSHNACRECTRRVSKQWQWKTRGIKNADGSQFTLVDYDRAYQIQSGLCKLCGKHNSILASPLQPDHCHIDGHFRGLLCNECNTSIGKLGDTIESVEKVLNYLKGI